MEKERNEVEILMRASISGDLIQVKKLLDAGLSPDAVQGRHLPAMHFAAMLGQTEVVRLLLEYGADPNRRGADNSTALICAVQGADRGAKICGEIVPEGPFLEIIKLLLDAGCDRDTPVHPNNYFPEGYTARTISKNPKALDLLDNYATNQTENKISNH